jgi:hypothetical protein
MAFSLVNPFNFNKWKHVPADGGVGGQETGDDVELGKDNEAGANNCTLIKVHAANNVALFGENLEPNEGGIGVFGVSRAVNYGIGAGGSASGTGVYGVSSKGLGVVGRAMGHEDIEKDPLEKLMNSVGVFGNSIKGPGIRGHGGTGMSASPKHEREPRPIGAVFSAGELEDAMLNSLDEKHEVTSDSFAQMQLIPSNTNTLPGTARIGDFYLAFPDRRGAMLFICTGISGSTPKWRPVQMGAELDGGAQF